MPQKIARAKRRSEHHPVRITGRNKQPGQLGVPFRAVVFRQEPGAGVGRGGDGEDGAHVGAGDLGC